MIILAYFVKTTLLFLNLFYTFYFMQYIKKYSILLGKDQLFPHDFSS